MTVSGVEYVIVAVYLALLLVVGWAFRKFNTNASDYFRSGGMGTWWLVGTSLFIGAVSSSTFTATAGLAFDAGLTAIASVLGFWIGILINVVFLAKWFRQLRCITFPEVLRLRFGVPVEQLYSITSMFFQLVFAAITLWAVATFTSSIFGMNLYALIIGIGVVILFYSTTGGRWAVMATDFLQGVILVPMAILMAYLSMQAIGGVDGMFEAIRVQNLATDFALVKPEGNEAFGGQYTLTWIIAATVMGIILSCQLGASVRYFSCKDGKEAQGAAGWNLLLTVPTMFIFIIPPIVARLLWSDAVLAQEISKPAESAYAIACLKLLPTGLLGLMVTAMFAASMANIDTGLNANAAVYVQNMHPLLLRILGRKPKDDAHTLRLSQYVSVFFGILIISIALYFAWQKNLGMFEVMLNFMGMFGLPLVVPVAMALWIRRGPSWAPFPTILLATIPGVVKLVLAQRMAIVKRIAEEPDYAPNLLANFLAAQEWMPAPWNYQWSIVSVFAIGIPVYLLCMPFEKRENPEYKAKVKEFYRRMHTPIDFATEVGPGNDHIQCRVLGNFVSIIGVLILFMLFIPSNASGDRWGIVFVSLFIVIVGLTLRLAGMTLGKKAAVAEEKK